MFLRRITWSFCLTFLVFFTFAIMIIHRTPTVTFYGSEVIDTGQRKSNNHDLFRLTNHDRPEESENIIHNMKRRRKFSMEMLTDKPGDNEVKKCLYNITVQNPGRLGNLMFAYASLIGIARKLKMTPVIDKDNPLRLFFKISTQTYDSKSVNVSSWTKFDALYSAAYEHRVEHIECDDNVMLNGYFQSWRYFEEVERTIRKEFVFKDLIQRKAESFLQKSVANSYGSNYTRNDVVIIGIHVRRSDMTDYESRQKGYVVANRQYIQASMTFFEAQYSRILFVVCSDDLFWVQQNVKSESFPVVYSENFHAILDLAILSLSDHVIITVGSFGWWGAYLAGGRTVYMSDFPRKYSLLDDEYRAKDYFYPGWRGIPSS